MAADSGMWWAVWWPEMILWTITLAAAIAAAWIFVGHWRGRGKDSDAHPTPGICFYLHDDSVMDLYLQGGYKTALRQEVEEEISSSKDAAISAEFSGVGGRAGKTVDRKIFRKYIEKAEPIAVIRIIMDVLDKAADIVYLDLIDSSIESGKALNRAMRVGHNARTTELSFSSLRDLEVYVSVRGRFREVAKTVETVTFAAPCGPGEPNLTPQAHVTCVATGVRRTVPQGTFQARCLGRLQDWNTETRELVIDPIAIFQ